jgi:hypothetical protein
MERGIIGIQSPVRINSSNNAVSPAMHMIGRSCLEFIMMGVHLWGGGYDDLADSKWTQDLNQVNWKK